MITTKSILYTLQYCLETFWLNCQCGECDPCTKGQADLRTAIQALEHQQIQDWPSGTYLLQRESIVVKLATHPALLQFVRELVPASIPIHDDASNDLLATMLARNQWTLTAF